jgi:acetyl-CoA acetyltransferase
VTAAIAGIGATEFSKDSGRSELRLAAEACLDAITDAGLTPADVDGMVTFAQDGSAEIAVARELGIPGLTFFSRVEYGGGAACGTVALAAMAVATGHADVVVCYRAFNERSGRRFGRAAGQPALGGSTADEFGWHLPYGLATPAAWVAMHARRYMHTYGVTGTDLGRVAVAMRRHAATNPRAWFYRRPITLAEHQASRWITEPLRLLDCCQESDGGVALVVTSAERAADLPNRPAVVRAAAQGSARDQMMMFGYYHDDLTALPAMGVVADQLWRRSGLTPADMQAAILYDHFTPFVLIQLEELGFCGRGEAKDYVAGGGIEIGGAAPRIPVNPNGGQLGEAYIHGMNGIAEAVRQIRGTAANQIDGVENVVVTAGTGVPTSGLILSRASSPKLPHLSTRSWRLTRTLTAGPTDRNFSMSSSKTCARSSGGNGFRGSPPPWRAIYSGNWNGSSPSTGSRPTNWVSRQAPGLLVGVRASRGPHARWLWVRRPFPAGRHVGKTRSWIATAASPLGRSRTSWCAQHARRVPP